MTRIQMCQVKPIGAEPGRSQSRILVRVLLVAIANVWRGTGPREMWQPMGGEFEAYVTLERRWAQCISDKLLGLLEPSS